MSSRAEQLRRIAREQKAQQILELSDEIFELLMAMSPMQSRMEIIAYQHFHFDGGDWHGIYHANRTVLRVLRTPELGNSNFANVLRLHGFAYGDFFIFPLQWVNSVWLEDFFYCSWWCKSKASVASLCWYGTMVALIIVESLSSTFVDLSSLSCHCHLFRL